MTSDRQKIPNPDTDPAEKSSGQHKPFGIMVRILFSPVTGFKRLKASGLTPEAFNAAVFFPLLAIVSASSFIGMIYFPDTGVSDALRNAISVFISFFLTYFAIFPLMQLSVGKEHIGSFTSPYGRKMVSAGMSSLVIFYTLYELCPLLEPILFFSPLYTVYLFARGFKWTALPQNKKTPALIELSIISVFMPYLIDWAFGILNNLNSLL